MATFLTFLPYLVQAANSVPKIMDFILKTKENFQARGEWTADADAAFTAELENWSPQI